MLKIWAIRPRFSTLHILFSVQGEPTLLLLLLEIACMTDLNVQPEEIACMTDLNVQPEVLLIDGI